MAIYFSKSCQGSKVWWCRTCSQLCGSISCAHVFVRVMQLSKPSDNVTQIHMYINFIYFEIQCRLRKLVFYRKRDQRARKHKLKKSKQFLTNFNIFEWINLSMHAFPQLFLYINLNKVFPIINKERSRMKVSKPLVFIYLVNTYSSVNWVKTPDFQVISRKNQNWLRARSTTQKCLQYLCT